MSLASMFANGGSYVDPSASHDWGWAALNGEGGEPTSDAEAQQIVASAKGRGAPIEELPSGSAIPAGYIGVGSFGGKQYVMSASGYKDFQNTYTAAGRQGDGPLDALKDMAGGLSIAALPFGVSGLTSAGILPAADGVASAAAAPGTLAGVAGGSSPLQVAAANTGTMTDVSPGLLGGGEDVFSLNTAANPSNIFNVGPSSTLGSLTNTGTASSLYDLVPGASGAAATGVSAIDAPGMVTNLNGGGAIPGVDPSMWNQAKELLQNGKSAADIGKLLGLGAGATSALGSLAGAGLGAFASNQQAGAYKDLADKYLAIGAPSRSRYEASFQPGFTMENDPGYKDALALTTKETLNRLSPGGNPAGSPNAWNQTLQDVNTKLALPALQSYRSTNAASGGLGALTAAAPAANSAAINANAGVANSLGAGAENIFNPPQTLADLLKAARAA